MPEKMIEVPEAQLRELLAQNERFKKNEAILIECVDKSMQLIGIWDENKKVNPEISENKAYFKVILKTLKNKISFTNLILGGKKAEKEIKENFGFLSQLKPIIDEYSYIGRRNN